MRCPRARRVTSATLRDFERRLQGCVRVCIYIYTYTGACMRGYWSVYNIDPSYTRGRLCSLQGRLLYGEWISAFFSVMG